MVFIINFYWRGIRQPCDKAFYEVKKRANSSLMLRVRHGKPLFIATSFLVNLDYQCI